MKTLVICTIMELSIMIFFMVIFTTTSNMFYFYAAVFCAVCFGVGAGITITTKDKP